MHSYEFRGWVKVPATFRISDANRDEAVRRAQLGDYDSFIPEVGLSPIDFHIDQKEEK